MEKPRLGDLLPQTAAAANEFQQQRYRFCDRVNLSQPLLQAALPIGRRLGQPMMVLRQIEGPLAPARRGSRDNGPADSPFPELWEQVGQALSSVIDQTTFADLCARWQEKTTRAVADWQI